MIETFNKFYRNLSNGEKENRWFLTYKCQFRSLERKEKLRNQIITGAQNYDKFLLNKVFKIVCDDNSTVHPQLLHIISTLLVINPVRKTPFSTHWCK